MSETKVPMNYSDDSNESKGEPKGESKDEVLGLDVEAVGDITLKSSDEKSFTLPKKSAFISRLVSQALENDANATEVPIPGAKAEILDLVVKYMIRHNGDEPPIIEKPLRSKIMKDVCKDKWDAEFIDEIGNKRQQLYDLILAANYMDVKSLLHLGCAKVASLIKGQPLEKIKEILAVDQPNTAASSSSSSSTDAPTAPTSAPGEAEPAPVNVHMPMENDG